MQTPRVKRVAVISLAVAVAGCAPAPGSSGLASPTPGATIAVATPTPPPPTAAPTATPRPSSSPTPSPLPHIAWSQPRLAIEGDCWTLAARIDSASRYHVASTCDQKDLVYAMSSDGEAWSASAVGTPDGTLDSEPEFAFFGPTMYLAFTRYSVDGSCGTPIGRALGVFVRQRTLPDGPWSDAVQIGQPGDRLEEFRVDGLVSHLAVVNDSDNLTYYERSAPGSFSRYAIPDVIGDTSLQIEPDGLGMLAHRGNRGIQMATLGSEAMTWESLPPQSTDRDWEPRLVMDGWDRHVLFTRGPAPYGCAGDEMRDDDGTYYATGGGPASTWVIERITKSRGEKSLALGSNGTVHAVVFDTESACARPQQQYFISDQSGWSAGEVLALDSRPGMLLRFDPVTDVLVGTYLSSNGVFVTTRP